MRSRVVLLLLLASCGPVCDYRVESLCVQEEAAGWPDTPEGLLSDYCEISGNCGAELATRAFDVVLRIAPGSQPLEHPALRGPAIGAACLYTPGTGLIQARVVGESYTTSCVPWEWRRRRLPDLAAKGHPCRSPTF